MIKIRKKVVPRNKAPWKVPAAIKLPWAWRVKSKHSEVIGYCKTEPEAQAQANNTPVKISQYETSAGPQKAFRDFKLEGSN